jgi:1-acyl-sn-glycerol-3-phosphate acyltransferase
VRFPSVLDALRSYLGLAVFAIMGLAWTPPALLLGALLPPRAAHAAGRAVIHAGFRAYLGLLRRIGACRFDLSALDALRDQGPMILAPNHPSLIDAVLVLSRLSGPTCVMKAGLLANPVLGAGARLAGYIPNDDLRRMIELAVAELRAGSSLLLFPEGTRSSAEPIGPIRGMVALIAKQAAVPVQTVLIEADSPFLGKRWALREVPRLPIRYRVRLGRRFDPPRHAQDFVQELDAYFREALGGAAEVGAPPDPSSRA